MVTLQRVQGHTGLTHHLKVFFGHSGTLALRTEHQSARMSKKLKWVGETSMSLNVLVDSFLPQSEKCGNERVKAVLIDDLFAFNCWLFSYL